MADFLHSGWSVFIAATVLGGLVACLALLFAASRRTAMADDNSTGHVFDGDLKEMNNPLPRWWMVLFVLTVVFGVGYAVVYPTLGAAPGEFGWSSLGQYRDEQAAARQEMEGVYARLRAMPAEEMRRDAQAQAIGERLFINNCATCHGSDAKGSKGFPNLTDGDWLHGGAPEQIAQTITHGRVGTMPPMADAIGGPAEARKVAHYVLSLSGSPHNTLLAYEGKAKFSACAACHGANGKGNTAIGAPNLTDGVWLHGWGEQAIVDIITRGKTNTMPAQKGRLTADQIHVLAGWVWGLSNRAEGGRP